MNTLELLDKKELLKKRATEILTLAEKESRKLNQGEQVEFDSLLKEVADAEQEIRKIDKDNLKEKINTKTKKTMENFSITNVINTKLGKSELNDIEQERINEVRSGMAKSGLDSANAVPFELRGIQATVATKGIEAVPTEVTDFESPLIAKSVLGKIGVRLMTGLSGDVNVPVYAGTTVNQLGEIVACTDGAGAFTNVALKPKRYAAVVEVSDQFLMQNQHSVDSFINAEVSKQLVAKIESDTFNATTGLFKGVTADAAEATYKDIVAMETSLEAGNSEGAAYVVSPSAAAKLRVMTKDSGSGRFVMEDNKINGIPVIVSTCIPARGIILADWNKLIVGTWGNGYSLKVDDTTKSEQGIVRLVFNAFACSVPVQSEAFAVKVLKA